MRIYYTDGTYLTVTGYGTEKSTNVFVTNANKTVRNVTKTNSGGTTSLYYDESGIFEGVLTADDFVAYSGTTKSITFPDPPGTVYGGTMTINKDGTGVMVVTDAKKVITEIQDMNSATGYGYIYAGVNGLLVSNVGLCNMLNIYTGLASEIGYGMFKPYNSDAYNRAMIIFRISSDLNGNTKAATKANYNNYLQTLYNNGTPLEVVYKLAEPVTYNLTSSQVGQILSLIGQNNVWVDNADSVSVEFWTH